MNTSELIFLDDIYHELLGIGFIKVSVIQICREYLSKNGYWWNENTKELYVQQCDDIQLAMLIKNNILPFRQVKKYDIVYSNEYKTIYYKSEDFDCKKYSICKGYAHQYT